MKRPCRHYLALAFFITLLSWFWVHCQVDWEDLRTDTWNGWAWEKSRVVGEAVPWVGRTPGPRSTFVWVYHGVAWLVGKRGVDWQPSPYTGCYSRPSRVGQIVALASVGGRCCSRGTALGLAAAGLAAWGLAAFSRRVLLRRGLPREAHRLTR
jgi:hypothetical protein